MPSDDDDLDLSALEDAVAELGLDVPDSADEPAGPQAAPAREDGPAPLDVDLETGASRNPGLDLTELPPPNAPPKRSMPPLGEATADDLFGPLDDDELSGSVWDEPSAAPAAPAAPTAPPSPLRAAASDPSEDSAARPDDTTGLGDQEPLALAEADPAMAGVVGFTAHGGTITGTIRAKSGKKLFGR